MIGTGLKRAAFGLAAGLLLASCGPSSYPKDKLAERLMGVCKAEYGLDVKAQVVGTTLGAMVEVPGLIDELRKHTPSAMPEMPPVLIEGRYAQQAFDFRLFTRGSFARVGEKKPVEEEGSPKDPAPPLRKLQQVSTAMMRASLSTDAPIEFYRLIARDPGPDRLDLVLSGHIMDTKRVQAWAISISDLQSRNEITLRAHPEAMGQAIVADFILDLSKMPLPQLLSRYTAPSKRFGELMPMVMSAAADLKDKEELLKPDGWPVRQIRKDAVLVYLPLEQVGGSGAYLFTVQLDGDAGSLLSIEKTEGKELPEAYREYGAPETWKGAFFLEEITLSTFVTEQIAKRVMSEFKLINPEEAEEDPKAKKAKKAPEKPATIEEVTKSLMGAAAYVTDSYDFKGFKEVTVVDALQGTRWSVPASQLPLYRNKRDAPDIKPIP